jgi:hypothetical protein
MQNEDAAAGGMTPSFFPRLSSRSSLSKFDLQMAVRADEMSVTAFVSVFDSGKPPPAIRPSATTAATSTPYCSISCDLGLYLDLFDSYLRYMLILLALASLRSKRPPQYVSRQRPSSQPPVRFLYSSACDSGIFFNASLRFRTRAVNRCSVTQDSPH